MTRPSSVARTFKSTAGLARLLRLLREAVLLPSGEGAAKRRMRGAQVTLVRLRSPHPALRATLFRWEREISDIPSAHIGHSGGVQILFGRWTSVSNGRWFAAANSTNDCPRTASDA